MQVPMNVLKDSVFNQTFDFESSLIDIKQYFEDYAKLLTPFERCQEVKCKNFTTENSGCDKEDCKNDKFYRDFLGLTQDQLKELKERTSIDHLTCEGEVTPVSHKFYKKFDELTLIPDKVVPVQTDLLSVKERCEGIDDAKDEPGRYFYKYSNYKWCASNDVQTRTRLKFVVDDLNERSNSSNLVAAVRVYHPSLTAKNRTTRFKLLQEIHILGNQRLSELKDKIVCALDYIGDQDVSCECFLENVGIEITAKDEYPSSFIFIENTFYNDTRQPNCIDLSEELREWCAKQKIGEFNSASMEKTKICDLSLKVGHPYVYQHQSNCEHIIVFSDLRFLSFSDSYKPTCYPRTHAVGRAYGRHCMMCSDSYARWVVAKNERLTHDKTYLCNKCFDSYNYINGQKVGQFEAYKYVDPIALL